MIEARTPVRRRSTAVADPLGYTGRSLSAEQLEELKTRNLPDDCWEKAARGYYEDDLRGNLRQGTVERDAAGRKLQVRDTVAEAKAELASAGRRHQEQKLAQQALQWGMKTVGLKRGVVIVMNPKQARSWRWSAADLRQQLVARGISGNGFRPRSGRTRTSRLNHAVSAHYPPAHVQARGGDRRPRRQEDHALHDEFRRSRTSRIGETKFWEWNHRRLGGCDLDLRVRVTRVTRLIPALGQLGIDVSGTGKEYGLRGANGGRSPGEVSDRADERVEDPRPSATRSSGRGLPSGDRAGYDAVTPTPADQRVRALANGGSSTAALGHDVLGPDGQVVKAFEPTLIRELA